MRRATVLIRRGERVEWLAAANDFCHPVLDRIKEAMRAQPAQ